MLRGKEGEAETNLNEHLLVRDLGLEPLHRGQQLGPRLLGPLEPFLHLRQLPSVLRERAAPSAGIPFGVGGGTTRKWP